VKVGEVVDRLNKGLLDHYLDEISIKEIDLKDKLKAEGFDTLFMIGASHIFVNNDYITLKGKRGKLNGSFSYKSIEFTGCDMAIDTLFQKLLDTKEKRLKERDDLEELRWSIFHKALNMYNVTYADFKDMLSSYTKLDHEQIDRLE